MSQASEDIEDYRILAIGDIHGCSTALRALIDAINPGADDLVVPLGDFIDCGPDSRGVMEQFITLSKRCRMVPLLGNHEEMLLNALESKSEFRYWLKLGGKQTLESYSLYRSDLEVIPAEHVAFIRRCRNYFETQTHIFVHGNYEPELPMHQIDGGKLRWGAPGRDSAPPALLGQDGRGRAHAADGRDGPGPRFPGRDRHRLLPGRMADGVRCQHRRDRPGRSIW